MKVKKSSWRLLVSTPTIGDEFNGLVLFLVLPVLFFSLIFKVMWINAVPLLLCAVEIYRIKKKLFSLYQVPKYLFRKHIAGHSWHGFRRSVYGSLTSIAGLLFVASLSFSAYAGFTVIIPDDHKVKPNVVQTPHATGLDASAANIPQSTTAPLGGEFIENRKVILGGGPSIELDRQLKLIVPGYYTIEFKSVELASMLINWRSTSFTLDQVLGNLAMRYGIMFETMHGSSVLSVDWFDEQRCSRESKTIFKRICGTSDGFYID